MMPFFRYTVRFAPVHPARFGLIFVFATLIFFSTSWGCLIPGTAHADVVAEFNEKFTALIPPENSSVHSDYLFEQIALGSRYTVIQLEQIREQAAANKGQFEKLSKQLDILIEQNQQLIELLKKEKYL